MFTKEVSQKYFNNALITMHKARRDCLFETTYSLLNEAKLTISSLGQNKSGNANVKHKIKSVDRLIGNSKLHKEIPTVYKELFEKLIYCTQELYISVDWSGCCGNENYMLRASLNYDGRSITLYNEIHPKEKAGNRKVQNNFLNNLKKMIPIGKKVVIITDSGFVSPWFMHVLKLGWHFIGRLPRYIMLKFFDKQAWTSVGSIQHKRKNQVKKIGKAILGKCSKNPIKCNVYSYQEKSKYRKEKTKFPDQNKLYKKIFKTPWILATSLNEKEGVDQNQSIYGGNFIKNRYKNRMQIEQNFRDEKSPRFGFGWRLGRTKCLKRIAILCLIAHIAAFFLMSLGIMAEKLNMHKKFQVNTRSRRVLSFLSLAKQIVKQGVPPNLTKEYENCLDLFLVSFQELSLC